MSLNQIHTLGPPARLYAEAGGPVEELAAGRALAGTLGRDGELVTALPHHGGLEVWAATDGELAARLTAYVLRWRAHSIVMAVTIRDVDDDTLAGAVVAPEVLERYGRARDLRREHVEAELAVALRDATPVDVVVSPERWRWRSGLLGLDVTLRAVPVDRSGARRIVAAEPRAHSRGRGRRTR